MSNPGLDQILALEAEVRDQLADPLVHEVRIPNQFCPQQVGLEVVMAGPDGRLWVNSGHRGIKLIFDPKWLNRSTIP